MWEYKVRYKRIAPGIRRDLFSGKFQATKTFSSKCCTKSFPLLSEAKYYLRNFKPPVNSDRGDNNEQYTLGNMVTLYTESHLNTLALNSKIVFTRRLEKFFKEKADTPMSSVTIKFIDELLNSKKSSASLRRASFSLELKLAKAFFNWHADTNDSHFLNPIKRRHFKLCKVKSVPEKRRKLNPQEINLFLMNLNGIYKDFAIIQLFTASRVSEVAGLHWTSVDFSSKALKIKHCLVWDGVSIEIKEFPKNNKERLCAMNSLMEESLKSRESDMNGNLVFHRNGQPLSYREIQYNYRKALIKSGLSDVASTHFLRHSAINIVRSASTLDHAQSIADHKSRMVVERIYSDLPSTLQKQASDILQEQISVFV